MSAAGERSLRPLALLLVAAFLLMAALSPARFLEADNLRSMAFQLPELGLLSAAMMLAMLSGGMNLSIIASANLAGIAAGMVLTRPGAGGGAGTVALATAAALGVAAAIGLLNGLLVAVLEVSPILATLGTMTLVNGVSIVFTKGYVISGFPEAVGFIGNGLWLGVPFPLLLFAVVAALLAMILDRSVFGLQLRMLGSNPMAALYSGVDNRGVLVKTYVLSGLLTGLAALVMISRFNSVATGYGASYLLVTILACVLGGVSTDGGFGRVQGLALALLVLQVVSSGLNLLGVNAFLTLAIWGLIVIAVMWFTHIGRLRRERGAGI